jgi:hypothetical protein
MGSHVVMELLAYLDGELSDRERARVEAHLAECSRCTAELEQLRMLRRELDATFDAALSPVRLPAAADARIRDRLRARTGPRPLWRLWQRRGLVAQALLAVCVLVFVFATQQTISPPLPAGPQETLVIGQDRLAPGSQAALRVLVHTAAEAAAPAAPIEGAEIVVRIGRTPGLASIAYTGRTDANGTAEVAFTVPEDLEGEASLVIETSSAGGEDRIVRPITITRDYKLFLSSDKSAYRPGQTIRVRALTLDAVGLRPAAGKEIAFTVFDPAGRRLEHRMVPGSDFGIAGFDFSLPPDAPHGQYALQAALGDTISERLVDVGAYELPAFRVAVETGRTFYGPGQRVTGFVQAECFFGKPVADGQVTLRGYVGAPERVQVVQVLGDTDDQGRFEFTFDLPPSLGRGATEEPVSFDLEVEIADMAGQREGIRRVLPVAAQPIIISAVPENGLLEPNVENVIFILTSYPDGRPAQTALKVSVDGREHLLSTGPYGLAEFRHVPMGSSTRFHIHARDAQEAEGDAAFTVESDRAPQTLLLRAERAVYEVGDTLRAEALLGGVGEAATSSVYLDVVRAGQTVATLSAPVEDGRAVFALDLDGTMIGALELHAYSVLPQVVRGSSGDDGSVMNLWEDSAFVQDARLVVVKAPRQVAVAVTADREEYRPGETAYLQVQTDRPAALGIGVVDESVYAIETQPPGFARAYFLLEREFLERQAPGLDLPALLDAEAEIQAAQDMAARAAWADVPAAGFTLSVQSVAEPQEDTDAQVVLSNQLGLLLVLLPLILSAVVARGLGPTGVLGRALRRVAVGGLMLCVASPLVALVVGGGMWGLWAAIGAGAPVAILMVVVVLWGGLTIHGWLRRDTRVQLATGLLAAYLALGGLLVTLAARGGDPHTVLLALIVVTFLLAVAALTTLGQGLVLEGWRRSGWATTLLGLLLIPLVVYLPFVPGLASGLTWSVGNPTLYAGPVGWLVGCAYAPTEEPMEAESSPEAAVEATAVPAELTEAPAVEEPAPTPAPTASPAPSAGEPFPLRQVFPETLYWNAEALTDEDGRLALDLPLSDNVTTWRLTALASTQDGELGVASYDIVVFQDFFIDLSLPPAVSRGEEVVVTVTLYNYLPQAQIVQIEPTPDRWYHLVSPPPQALTLHPNDVATARFTIRAEQSGRFSLQVRAAGEGTFDAVAREVTVEQ